MTTTTYGALVNVVSVHEANPDVTFINSGISVAYALDAIVHSVIAGL